MVTRLLVGGGTTDNPYKVANVRGTMLVSTNMSEILTECANAGVNKIKYQYSGRYLTLRGSQWYLTSDTEVCDKAHGLPPEGKQVTIHKYLKVVETVTPVSVLESVVVEKTTKYLELKTYRKAGVVAYLIENDVDHTKYRYGKPASEEDKQRAYKSKAHTIKIRVDDLPDGRYKFKEAGGAHFKKSRYGFVVITNGEITDKSYV